MTKKELLLSLRSRFLSQREGSLLNIFLNDWYVFSMLLHPRYNNVFPENIYKKAKSSIINAAFELDSPSPNRSFQTSSKHGFA